MKRSLRSWLWRVPIDQEVHEELDLHVELRTRELIARGMDPKTAREIALSRLGDVTRLTRTCVDLGRKRDREMRITQRFEEFRDDVKFAMRQLRGSPAFTTVAVLTLALGIGVNSAVFALADAAFFRPLPFPAPVDRLVMVWERRPNGFMTMASPLEFRDWNEQNQTFEAMAAMAGGGGRTMIGPDGTAEQIPSQTVTARFFDVLGVRPLAGRTFLTADATLAPNVVVISEGFWRRRFAADPSAIGRDIVLDGLPFTVIGIVPAEFQIIPPFTGGTTATSDPSSLWILATEGGSLAAQQAHYVHVIGRLKPGVTREAASHDMAAVAERIARAAPATNAGHSVAIDPLRASLIGREVRLTSMVLFGVVAFVLLMCCANVANLLLARTTARARELAVRSALGAGRRRIGMQLLTESLVLAALGGLLGIGIGAAILQAAPSLIPPGLLPNAVTLMFDGRVVTFCAAMALLVGLLFGLAPAWQSTGMSLVHVVSAGGRTTRGGARLRGLLVVGEVAAAVLVLSGAGLLLRTWVALGAIDPGYRAGEVLTMTVALPMPGPSPTKYRDHESLRQFYDGVQQELERRPGVRRVAWGGALPLDGWWFGQAFEIAGDAPEPDGNRGAASYHMVSPHYFATLGIPIVSGRSFTDADTKSGAPVCIVSEAFVRRHLGGRDPLGMRVRVPLMSFASPGPVEREIVGVAGQVKGQPDERLAFPQIYVPLAQNAWWSASLVVQPDSGAAESLVPTVRAAIARVDSERAVTRVRTLDGIAWGATARPRFRAVLVATFAGLALVLAMVGVFGVLAYSVQQRTREFGVRIALGASMFDVMRLVLAGAARTTAVGAAIGLVCAGVVSRSIATLLFGVQPLDPVTFSAAAAVLLVTVAVATAAPALRAARVDPVVAFRNE